eukprot:comp11817_c0_seq1/m.6439 comp11817_c0_seq1/g.6439  ORF comp11817_c0_seq1/g.6439 comp11817_c0_seq1/m.6439 type:complete len:394 (-) comp11817_c0_seq1:32-1213(-)
MPQQQCHGHVWPCGAKGLLFAILATCSVFCLLWVIALSTPSASIKMITEAENTRQVASINKEYVPLGGADLVDSDWTQREVQQRIMEWRARGYIPMSANSGKPFDSVSNITDLKDVRWSKGVTIPQGFKVAPRGQKPIPALVHFFKADQGSIRLTEYISISSAMTHLPNGKAILHAIYGNPPNNAYLSHLMEQGLEVRPYNKTIIDERLAKLGKNISTSYTMAHYSDFARIDIVSSLGGFYFDTDAVVVSNLEPLRHSPLLITGQENYADPEPAPGSMAAPANSEFGKFMFEAMYEAYNADCWTCHLVHLARRLAKERPDSVQVAPIPWFNPERWDGESADRVLLSPLLYPDTFALHLYKTNRAKIDAPEFLAQIDVCRSVLCGAVRHYLHPK